MSCASSSLNAHTHTHIVQETYERTAIREEKHSIKDMCVSAVRAILCVLSLYALLRRNCTIRPDTVSRNEREAE